MNVMTNQVDQLYVVTPDHPITIKDTKHGVYFTYEGAVGTTRSDIIKKDQVMSATVSTAQEQRVPLKAVTVTLADEDYLISGEDYQIKLVISQFQDLAEDSLYYKYGFVHATAAMVATPGLFWESMIKSLCYNFAREITKFFAFGLTDGVNVELYDEKGRPTTKTITGGTATVAVEDATGIVIYELAQDWNLALMPKEGVNFSVYTDKVMIDGDEVTWGEVSEPADYSHIGNGYTLADMEYFYMGERGDQYRMFARPQDRIHTQLLVQPKEEYDVINIHYYFVDSLGGVQKSEKDITLVVTPTLTESVTTALEEALGITMPVDGAIPEDDAIPEDVE